MATKPSLFIIESVGFEEESKGFIEGKVISQILNLCDVKCDYYFIRTQREFIATMKFFEKSTHRYLHISCHGSDNSVGLSLESLSFYQFGKIVSAALSGRRLFLSACQAVNRNLAEQVLKNGCNSVTGPKGDILFSDAAIMWASFYHLLFRMLEKEKKPGIIQSDLDFLLREVVDTFSHPMRCYYPNKNKTITKFYKKEFVPLKQLKDPTVFTFS